MIASSLDERDAWWLRIAIIDARRGDDPPSDGDTAAELVARLAACDPAWAVLLDPPPTRHRWVQRTFDFDRRGQPHGQLKSGKTYAY